MSFFVTGFIAYGFSALHLSLLCGAPLGEFVLGGAYKVIPIFFFMLVIDEYRMNYLNLQLLVPIFYA